MPESTLETLPASQYTVLLTLKYGSTTARYCRWTNDLVLGDGTFIAEPSIDVQLGQEHGGTEDKQTTIQISRKRSPFDRLVSGYSHGDVFVTVEQIDPQDITTRKVLFVGWVGKGIKNPSGKSGLVRVQVDGIKSRQSEIRISLPIVTTCLNTFASARCGAEVDYAILTGVVTAIVGAKRNRLSISFAGISTPDDLPVPRARYRRGFVEVDGHKIMVKNVTAQTGDIRCNLVQLPPPWWISQSVKLHPGCRKDLDSCRFWEREVSFRGLGIKLLQRNPLYQQD